MAKRIFMTGSLSFDATAHGSAATTSKFMAVKGGSTTQIVPCSEFYIGGMMTSSTVAAMTVAYSSTLGITPTALASPGSDGPMVVSATALVSGSTVVSYFAAGTGPVPSSASTLPKMALSLNLFGGIVRWVAYPGEEWTVVGNAVNGGETVLWNSSTHGGTAASALANAHIVYEPV